MALLNSTILENAWLSGTNDYQQRIPNPAISSYAEHVEALFDPMNNDLFNSFANMLVGLMGTYVESQLFENPLRDLKKPAAQWGNTERGVAVKYLQAHSYKVDDETLLKLEKPEYVEWFYSVGEPRRYEFSWSKYEMQRVFSADGYGFDELLQATFTQMYSSDNYDEMNIMLQMFAEGDQRMNGLYREQISAAPTTEATAKELLVKIRANANRLKFPSMRYNHIPVPVHETPKTLVVWVTPEVDAYLDVEALAAVFNLDRADIQYRKIVIPEFPIPNVYAALTSEDFIYARDVWYGVEPPFYNPANLTYKYYLHHSEMIGVNPAANCILFSTDAGTSTPTITVTINEFGVFTKDGEDDVIPGGVKQLAVALNGTISPSGTKVTLQPNSAVDWSITATRGNNTPQAIPLNSRTYVDARNILHVQRTGLQAGDKLTINAKAAYINPSGVTETYTATTPLVINIASALNPDYRGKNCSVEEMPYITYNEETIEATASE